MQLNLDEREVKNQAFAMLASINYFQRASNDVMSGVLARIEGEEDKEKLVTVIRNGQAIKQYLSQLHSESVVAQGLSESDSDE